MPTAFHVAIEEIVYKKGEDVKGIHIPQDYKPKVKNNNRRTTWSSTELISLPLSTVSRLIRRASLISASDLCITTRTTLNKLRRNS
jgi:hypothetical protein